MSDLIDRQAALDALGEEPPVWYDGEDEIAERDQWRRDVAAIKALPPAQPTLYGYSIESLAAVAEIMKKENVGPEEALQLFKNTTYIAGLIRAAWYENVQKQFEQAMFSGGQDGAV